MMTSSSRISGCSVFMLLSLLITFLSSSVVANPVPKSTPTPLPQTSCKNPIVRQEWRTLSDREQKDYLNAVQCFLTKPSISPKSFAPGAVSRYDDLVATHINQTFTIHYVAHFLHWHRYYLAYYETSLRNECGYRGAQPYWDWNQDTGTDHSFKNNPLFDDDAFGGNGPYVPITDPAQAPFAVPGRTGGGCVTNGVFKNMVVRMGPGADVSGNPRCLTRDLSPYFFRRYQAKNQTRLTMDAPDFYSFDHIVEGGPSFDASGIHGGGHYGIGGTLGIMGDLYNSPADPIFWMHHANLDRVYWSWQSKNLPYRLTDFNGPACILDYYNPNTIPHQKCNYNETSLATPMNLYPNHPGVTVADTMNIKGNYLCYDYDKLYNL